MVPLLYICILLPPLVTGLIGFDCAGHGLNITTLSLLDIGNCELAEIETSTEKIYVQLLQLSDYDKPRVQQCKVEVHRTIFYCGMHLHISVVQNDHRIYLQTLSNTAYQWLHETGTLSLGGNAIISGASPNSTYNRMNYQQYQSRRINYDGWIAVLKRSIALHTELGTQWLCKPH